MNIKYQNNNGRYYITVNGNRNTKIIACFLKLSIKKYENFLKENGGSLELDGNIYFYNKDKVSNVVKELIRYCK